MAYFGEGAIYHTVNFYLACDVLFTYSVIHSIFEYFFFLSKCRTLHFSLKIHCVCFGPVLQPVQIVLNPNSLFCNIRYLEADSQIHRV